ncbi:depupylase/deamidase Dop [Corynebacterium lizhenjunii]|uniref:depupylase/deamidase Dop n=1 Tax=Corynebacterium lizhenjunii TaxID=2709394 RepID=UPI0013EE21E9|nr:depupylase/deamidase Dop [Corynebacterium lizhenjunii]
MAHPVARFLGTETEYGITCPHNPALSPIVTSTHAVVAYAALHTTARSRWDFSEEHPLRDQRGFDLKRYQTVPVVDPNAIGVANVVTANGARWYVDHAHPEYSSPECTDAWEAMVYDAAGDRIALQAIAEVEALYAQDTSVLAGHDPCPPLRLYKNNVDGKGASYGAHENYLYSRELDFDVLAQALIPFFVARQVLTGAGRVGLEADGSGHGFQISQRADYIEQEISLETTLNRGIINTRDEPHARDFGRLHVIIGDATMAHTSTLLKLGLTSLVIDAVTAGVDFSDLRLANAVAEVRAVSRDLNLTHTLELADSRRLTALELLGEYRGRLQPRTDADASVLEACDEALAALAQSPLHAANLLDWCAKYRLYKAYLDRGLSPEDPRLAALDIQYADIDPQRSLYHALVRKGQLRTLATEEEIAYAAVHPPRGSRAYFRGRVTERFGTDVVAASWQSVTLRCGERFAIYYLDHLDSATDPAVHAAIEQAETTTELVSLLDKAGLAAELRVHA